MILSPGQTDVMDRGYQAHDLFDRWQEEKKYFVCRIIASTQRKLIKANEITPDSIIFYDAIVLLGTPGASQSKKPTRLVGYTLRVNHLLAACRLLSRTAQRKSHYKKGQAASHQDTE